MKRRISLPERHANTVEAIAHRVAAAWPLVEEVAAAQAPPTLRAAGSRDGGRNADHPDPTSVIALGHQYHDELKEAVRAWLEQGLWIEIRVNNLIRQHPELARHAAAELLRLRCSDPVCTNNAVRGGLCWAHVKQEQRARTTPDAPVSTAKVEMSTRGVVKPAEVDALRPSAVAWCHQCGRDLEVPAGVDPQAWLDQHRRDCAA